MSRIQHLKKNEQKNIRTKFSEGYTVLSICLALLAAMVVFGAGILVGRYDRSFESAPLPPLETEDAGIASQEMETYTIPASDSETPEIQGAPESTTAQRTPETPSPRNPYMDNIPRLTALPPLSPYRSVPVTAEAPTRIPRPNTSTLPTQVPTQPVPPPKPVLTPIDPVEPPVATTPVTAPPLVSTKPPAAVVASENGKFGVQLAAFSGSDRRTRSESFRNRILAELKVKSTIIPSSDDVHYRVIVGEFTTREAANKSCKDLRNKAGLNEAFVRPL